MKTTTYHIAFGDIHGCDATAERAIQLAEELNAQAIFLGDYVDRGPDSIRVFRLLIEAKNKHPDWVFIRGNHEQMLLDLMNKKYKLSDRGIAMGGAAEFNYKQCGNTLREWKRLPEKENKAIKKFVEETVAFYETEDVAFSHAILTQNVLIWNEKLKRYQPDATSDSLIWNYSYQPECPDYKLFVHGHLPVKDPFMVYNAININTSCGSWGGYLTGILMEFEDGRYTHNYRFYKIDMKGNLMEE